MFTNNNNKYGAQLTENQLEEFKIFIGKLKGAERNMLCESCHSKSGCGNDHNIHLTDTGVCTICGINTEVVNCSIANKVVNDDIPANSYWENGERIVIPYDELKIKITPSFFKTRNIDTTILHDFIGMEVYGADIFYIVKDINGKKKKLKENLITKIGW